MTMVNIFERVSRDQSAFQKLPETSRKLPPQKLANAIGVLIKAPSKKVT